jgi:hypothetical protein
MEAVVAKFTGDYSDLWLLADLHPIIVAGIDVGGIRKRSHAVVFVMDYMATGFKRRM